MSEGVTFHKGAESVTSKVPDDLCPSQSNKAGGPVEFFKGADSVSGADVPKDPTLNVANIPVGKGSPVKGPMDK